jgi:hypothetical protein
MGSNEIVKGGKMSGGRYEYKQYEIDRLADELEEDIKRYENEMPDEYGYVTKYSPETIAKFKVCMYTLQMAAAMLQRVDWLVCGDDGEDTFHRRWDDEMRKLNTIGESNA